MSMPMLVVILVALAAAYGIWRTARARHRGWIVSIVLQLVSAILLAFVLMPPLQPGGSESLLVLTAAGEQAPALQRDDAPVTAATHVVVLPGANADPSFERVPDLGTALRRYPRVSQLRVLGGGLPLRDRDSVRGLALAFDAAPLPHGIVELGMPDRIDAGSIWRLHGRVVGPAGSTLALHDRADAPIATATPDADGRFVLDVRAKGEGPATYSLRMLAADARVIEDVPVAVAVRAGDRVRALLLAGAPDAELKYLRRWALDAGIDLRTRIALSRGVALREGAVAVDAASLREFDLVIVDERTWAALARPEKEALARAIEEGLGMLLRVTGPVPAGVATEWAALGLRVTTADIAQSVALPALANTGATGPLVSRRPIAVDARDARTLITADDGSPLATWRAQGRGRIALWWLVDSYRLALGGDAQRFGSLWSEAFSTLARARAEATPELPTFARVDERVALCGVGEAAHVEVAGEAREALAIDPAAPGCAAFWPRQGGWHTLVAGAARWPFFVHAADQGIALQRMQTLQATQALVGGSPPSNASSHAVPGPRWPWFIAWLVVTAMLWWLERRALHRDPDRTP